MKGHDVIVLGDIVADIVMPIARLPLRANEHDWADGLFTELGGGCTTVVAARRAGLSVATLGFVGGDTYGQQVTEMLAEEGVDVSQVVAVPGRQTVLCVVITDKAGQHVFLGIKDHLPPERAPKAWREIIPQARCLYTNGYTLRDLLNPEDALILMDIATSNGVPIFFDPGPSIEFIPQETLLEVLGKVNVVILTEEEVQHLVDLSAGDAAQGLRRFGPAVAVVKVGQDGCYVAADDATGEPQVIYHPGFAVQVVDTVGAGDAFAAAFMAAYLRGGSMLECATMANAMGAALVETQGAGRSVPTVDRLVELMADDPAVRLLYA